MTITDSTTASIEVTEPELFEVSASMTPVTCNGDDDGTVSALTTGGTGVPTFAWDVQIQMQHLQGSIQ